MMDQEKILFFESQISVYENKIRRGVAFPSPYFYAIRSFKEEINNIIGGKR